METTPVTETQAEPGPCAARSAALKALCASVPLPPDPLDILREAYTQLEANHAAVLAAVLAAHEASRAAAEASYAAMRATLDRYVAAAAKEEKFYFAPPRETPTTRPSAWSGVLQKAGGRGEITWSGFRELGRLINPKRPVGQSNLGKRAFSEEPDHKGQYFFTYPGIDADGQPCRFKIIASQKPEGIDMERVCWSDFDHE